MLKALLCLLLAVQTLAAAVPDDSARVTLAMKSGMLLRMHVIAQDDTAEMQRIKLCVRDAVRQAYADAPAADAPMLLRAQVLLPSLTSAAQAAAADEGFTGAVSVSLEQCEFDARTLDGLTIPAGCYPALMIRLGDAQGHNWWGLIDPELSLASAVVPGEDGALVWDWSFSALMRALFGGMLSLQEDSADE